MQLDRRCRRLAAELRAAPGLRAAPVAAAPDPQDNFGSAQQFGVLLVSGLFSTTAVTMAARAVVAFLQCGVAASIRVRRGDREVLLADVSHESADDAITRVEKLLSDRTKGADDPA